MNGDDIFVFGSNLEGVHGAGAALCARVHHGARHGVGIGRTGRAYAIPTKASPHGPSLPLTTIEGHVKAFVAYALINPALRFYVTRIGCGLAGFRDEQIAPFFEQAPSNCILPQGWRAELPDSAPTSCQPGSHFRPHGLAAPCACGALPEMTPEQIHDLCHNLPATVSRAEFEAGCRAYQDKLYGPREN